MSESWIEIKINERKITEYYFEEFEEFKMISTEAFCRVYKASQRNTKNIYALKIIENSARINKELVNQLKHMISIKSHKNIIEFYGIAKFKDQMDPSIIKYVLVLEYCDGGTLRDYLQNNATNATNTTKIEWELKIQFAIQLVDAVKWLHDNDIIHGDLYSNSILIHQDTLKLADFGLLQREIFGVIPYIDPQCLILVESQDGESRRDKINKTSDIYSVGVILWEISSERPPFKDEDTATLPFKIRNGLREKPVANTNHKYKTIYEQCWQGMQDKRPSIQEVAMVLKNINAQDVAIDDNFDTNDINSVGKFFDNKLLIHEYMENDFDELIKKHKIAKHDYYKFSKFVEIGRGAFATVYKARWKDLTIALKSINKNDNTNQTKVNGFLNELQNLAKLGKHEHPNVIKFYGVTKNPTDDHYYLILQFAVDGNLRAYLKKNFPELRWLDKLRIAHEIAEGLSFLHDSGILHRDLHSKNILVHKRRIFIADFGVSKHIDADTIVKAGMIEFLEPQCFINYKYPRDKRSDIYSFGVVLWEISSGRPPFNHFDNIGAIIFHVSNGNRETPVENTPDDFVKLFQRCWDQDPAKRPEIKEVLEELNKIRSNEKFSTVITAEHAEEIISWIDPSSSEKNSGPSFGFSDLYVHKNSKKVRIWGCFPYDYEKPIKIIDNGSQKAQKFKSEKFQIEDYEVFQYL
ncbi:kinase-like protein [Gigaspora margarita]|uniref:Kinase-like protein n=1 Tax=Gigaspora margarita TaxID=4874 RepID=A0A8H4AJF5_GIGMA|nr:kinase-like protein [Gigaspora margarita]